MRNYFIRNSFTLLAAALLAIPVWAGIRGAAPGSSRTFTGEVTDTICAQSGSHAGMMAKVPGMGSDNASCTKKCAQIGAKYALVDDSTKTVYILENFPRAQAMAGQRVRLIGTLEGNKINVINVNALG